MTRVAMGVAQSAVQFQFKTWSGTIASVSGREQVVELNDFKEDLKMAKEAAEKARKALDDLEVGLTWLESDLQAMEEVVRIMEREKEDGD